VALRFPPTRPMAPCHLGRAPDETLQCGPASMLPAAGRVPATRRDGSLQSARPRDIGALALVAGMLLALLVISVMFGAPPR
jgi:hypothetical protein